MQERVPNYYHKFTCIADRCRHSCCVGWEIDIDEETMSRYRTMDNEMGKRILQNIEGDVPHFVLHEGDRCPFLQRDGLCEIIVKCGEDSLCDICHLHPRFRNFYENSVEIGLGLCCEEAARIILSETEKFSVPLPQDSDLEEEAFFAIRDTIFYILEEREKTVGARLASLAKKFGLSFGFDLDALRKVYLSLERLDETWTAVLMRLEGFCFDEKIFENAEFSLPLEQLAVYFVYRHLTDAMWDGDYAKRVRFALCSCYFIGALWAQKQAESDKFDFCDMVEIVRLYSAEIEYSEDNVERLMNL